MKSHFQNVLSGLPSRAPFSLRGLVAGAAFVLFATSAAAQDAPAGVAPAKETNDSLLDNSKEAPSEADKAPLASMENTAVGWVSEMKSKYDEGLDLLKTAKDAKDPLKQTCVSDKVTLMKGVLRIATNASSTLSEKIAINAEDQARRQLKKIEKNRQKMNELHSKAKNCTGAQSSFVGEGEVVVETSDDLNQPDSYYADTSHFSQPELREANGETGGVGESDPSTPDPLPTVSLSTE